MYMPLHVDDSQSRARKVSRSEVALLDEGDVGGNHLFAELLHRDLGHPAELLLGLGRVSDQQLDLGRPEVLRVDPHQDARLVRRVDADLVDALALPLDGDAHGGRRKGELDEVANRVCNSRRHDVVVRLVLLHHHPHHLDVVAGVAPVALCVNVAHVQCLLQPLVDPGHGASDLSGDEGGTAPRGLVVEQDPVARVHPVRLAVVDHDPVRVQLGRGVRRARVEGRRLALGHLLHEAVELRGGRLVEARLPGEARRADRVEQPQRAETVCVSRVLRHLERYLDVRLGTEVVQLVGPHGGDNLEAVGRVGQVTVVQVQHARVHMRVLVQFLDPAGVEGG
mmetsp:Transcript_10309/g.32597  ORF Transcript_10309/g.32597 Transcript_10309/m.32597 type:complete len:337 (-) Transcript_10309:231-1241(-)